MPADLKENNVRTARQNHPPKGQNQMTQNQQVSWCGREDSNRLISTAATYAQFTRKTLMSRLCSFGCLCTPNVYLRATGLNGLCVRLGGHSLDPSTDDEIAKNALHEPFKLTLGPGNVNDRLAAARLVLAYTKPRRPALWRRENF
jgi:hypothetical protein